MKFKLTIECDNDAFERAEEEVSRILHDTAKNVFCRGILDNSYTRSLIDINGNTVGRAIVTGRRP